MLPGVFFFPLLPQTDPASFHFFVNTFGRECYGDEGIRTLDLRLAKPALSQLSYIPGRLENTLFRMQCQESQSTDSLETAFEADPMSK